MRNIIKIPTLICIVIALNMVNLMCIMGHDLSDNRKLN